MICGNYEETSDVPPPPSVYMYSVSRTWERKSVSDTDSVARGHGQVADGGWHGGWRHSDTHTHTTPRHQTDSLGARCVYPPARGHRHVWLFVWGQGCRAVGGASADRRPYFIFKIPNYVNPPKCKAGAKTRHPTDAIHLNYSQPNVHNCIADRVDPTGSAPAYSGIAFT